MTEIGYCYFLSYPTLPGRTILTDIQSSVSRDYRNCFRGFIEPLQVNGVLLGQPYSVSRQSDSETYRNYHLSPNLSVLFCISCLAFR